MARILITAPPLVGHLNPALATAARLTQRGHRVAWAVHRALASSHLPPDATVYDLPPWTGVALDRDRQDRRGLAAITSLYEEYLIPMAEATGAAILAAANAFDPGVMVVDHQMIGGALAARARTPMPWVTLATTSASILKMRSPVEEWLQAHFARLQRRFPAAGPPVSRPDLSPFGVIVFSSERLLDANQERLPAPYHFVGPAHGGGRRAVAFPWEWLKPGLPLILVTLGTRRREDNAHFFQTVIAALRDLPVQAVVVAPGGIDPVPVNVLVRPYVPQLKLLERVAAVICHAGHNTVCEALARGIPLAVAPIRDDQPAVAHQVVDAGAGVLLRHGKVTVAAARTAIERLLHDPALRARAQELAAAFAASGGADAAAGIVERLPRGGALRKP